MKMREKLTGASKVTIFLRDDIYLEAKWACNGVDLKFIKYL